MQIREFPTIALALGGAALIGTLVGGMPGEDGSTRLPLLMLLTMCELAFFETGFGAYLTIQHALRGDRTPRTLAFAAGLIVLAGFFLIRGIAFWPR